MDADLLEAYWAKDEDWWDFVAYARELREKGLIPEGVKLA